MRMRALIKSLAPLALALALLGVASTHGLQTTKYLVVIVIDAFRPEYLQLAPLPNLQELMQQGVTYERAWVGHLINNTPPGHTTISTGSVPARHGVVGFGWKDPLTNKMVRPTSLEAINAGELTEVITSSGVLTLAGAIKEANPSAKAIAISAEKYYAAAAMGLPNADYIIYSAQRGNTLIPAAIRGYEPPLEILNDPNLRMAIQNPGDHDTWAMNVALKIFERERPAVLLINLPETDGKGHATGGLIAPQVMAPIIQNVDRQIGRLVEAYKEAGIYEQTVFVITADHGMVPNGRNIDPKVLEPAFRRAGAEPLNRGVHIWLKGPNRSAAAAQEIARLNIEGIVGVYYKTRDSAGNHLYAPAPITQAKLTSELNAAYRYLLGTYASPHGPDIALALAEDTVFGTKPPNTRGQHDTFTWGNQHIPLIISGPGVKQGIVSEYAARLADIAPTALALLGVAVSPEKMDGIVLADALLVPTEEQQRLQEQRAPQLRAYQEALIAQSKSLKGVNKYETSKTGFSSGSDGSPGSLRSLGGLD